MTYQNNQLSPTDHNVGSSNKSDNKDTSEDRKAAIMSIFQNIIPKNKRRREEDGIADIQEIFRHKFKKAVGRYRMDYPIFHRRNPDMTSFKRPSSTIAAIPNRDSFTVSVDDKREWPVYDHRRMPPINRTRIARTPHLAADPDFKIVLPEKPTLQPPKVYPPSRGLKLKSVENCMKQIPVPVEPPVSSSSSSSSLAKPVVTYDSNFVQSFLGSIKSITEQQEAAHRNPNDNRQRSKLNDVDDDDDAEDAYTSKMPYSTSEDPRDSLEEMSQDGMEGYNDEIYDTQFTPGTSDKVRSESCSSGSDTNDQTDNQDILSSDRHVTVDEYIDYLTEHGVDAKTIAQALVEARHLLHDGDDREDNDYEPLMETLKFMYGILLSVRKASQNTNNQLNLRNVRQSPIFLHHQGN
ncbi:hypothetical protein BDB01DRAFT_242481 [Pilobolus umbonatus]|nr:hypothetical protein BDB01DRAFT_242481 [Pilobolus umbonatus]